MTHIVDLRAARPDAMVSVCDCSPPRGADPALLEPVREVGADFLSIAYHPGKSTTVNSAFAAHWMQSQAGRQAMFTLSPRDMNQLALQSLLLGAALVGVDHVVIAQGDPFTEREQQRVRPVAEVTASTLIRQVAAMNEGKDFRGRDLASPTDFCIGATIDLNSPRANEPALTRRKVEAGARFFLMQALFSPDPLLAFLERYEQAYGEPLEAPLFCGLQVLTSEGIVFGDVPASIVERLEGGEPGEEIALETADRFLERGIRSWYVVPPILRGGGRDYATAARVLEQLPHRLV